MKHLNVCAAIIVHKDKAGAARVFCARRRGPKAGETPNETHGKWEFPGGKIEAGETPEAALCREIQEELGVQIEILHPLSTVRHSYKAFSVTLHVYICRIVSGTIRLCAHTDCRWVFPQELPGLDWAAADIPAAHKAARLMTQQDGCGADSGERRLAQHSRLRADACAGSA